MALAIIDPTGDNFQFDGPYKRLGDTKPGWTSTYDATPHSIASTQGSTGSLTFSASQANGESDLLVARDMIVEANIGKINSLTLQGENVSVTMDTIFARLNTQRTAKPWATDHFAGEFAIPRGDTITVAGSPRKIGEQSFIMLGSDALGAWVYFYGESKDSAGYFPVVLRYYKSGTFESAWSPSGGTAGDLSGGYGRGFAIDRVNNYIWLTNPIQTGGHYVKRYTLTGTFVSEFRPGTSGGVATVTEPYLTVDSSANVYVSGGPTGSVIQKFSNTGTLLANAGTTSVSGDLGFTTSPVLLGWDGVNIISTPTSKLQVRAHSTSLVFQANISDPNVGFEQPTGLFVDRVNEIIYSTAKTLASPTLRAYGTSSQAYNTRKKVDIPFSDIGLTADGEGRVFIPHITYPAPFALQQPAIQVFFDRDGPIRLSAMIQYYLSLILGVGDFSYVYAATDPYVLFPGWTDNVWEKLKELGAARSVQFHTFLMPYADGTKYRPVIQVTDTIDNNPTDLDQTIAQSIQLQIALSNVVRSYQIVNQNSSDGRFGNLAIVYNAAADGQTFSVDKEKTVVTTVSVPHSLVSVTPRLTERMGVWDPSTSSGFEVYDSENKQLPADLFTQRGGGVQASLIDDRTIQLIFTGPPNEIAGYPGPFTFAREGQGRLSIGGSGVLLKPERITMWTGADESFVTNESGPVIDSPFIENATQAYDRGAWASLELSGPRMDFSFDGDRYAAPTPGQRIRYNHQTWRVVGVNPGPYTTGVSAVPYTTVGEKDALWAGKTVGEYDAFWAGYRVYDSKVRPLQVTR